MSEAQADTPRKLNWRFPRTFWYANGAELFERAAFYGMFITLFRYLNGVIGFTDVETGYITSVFASILYFLPTFMGIMADKIGFKRALMLAFLLLTVGYCMLGAFQLKETAIISLTLIMFGGAIVKPVISGTVAKCSDSAHRARAMSIFYMVVNIGSFSGKGLAGPLNEHLGLQYINLYAAGMSFAAFILVSVFYTNVDTAGTGKTVREALRGLGRVCANVRFLSLILIIGGFWAIQGQLYASMPTYIERLLGKGYKPEWLANINPLVVVICVVPITHLIRNFKPANAIGISLLIIPFTALIIALGPLFGGPSAANVDLGFMQLHPIVVLFIIGIGLQGLAECFLSPKWLEFASKQAPEGEVGLYLGYSHLTTFFAWFFGFILAGYLLAAFCPDPKTFTPELRDEWRAATDPGYRCTLSADYFDKLPDEGVVPDEVWTALEKRGVTLAGGSWIEKQPPADAWAPDPESKWMISDGERTYTIEEARIDLEKTDGDQADVAMDDPDAKNYFVELLVLSDEARTRSEMPKLPDVYNRAHYLWLAFAGVGVLAFFSLLVFKFVTESIDRKQAGQTPA